MPMMDVPQPDLEGIVYLIDDDAAVREALVGLLRSAGLRTVAFASASEFARHTRPDVPSCLILDVQLPGKSGLELQPELAAGETPLPIVFLTGHGTIPMTVRAMKGGATEFLTKPVEEHALLGAIRVGLERHRAARREHAALRGLRARYDRLTPRERQVLALVVDGRLNKQIGAALGMAEQTVKVHRSRVMRKMEVRSVAELVKTVERILAPQ